MMEDPANATQASWDRLSALFDSASSYPPHERDAYLDRACAEDPVLRAEIGVLLAGADDAPQFLQHLVRDVVSPALVAATTEESESDDPLTEEAATLAIASGTRIRHYEVLEQVGAGGMGVVYRGRDLRLGRDVALKFLAPEQIADPQARRRLVREAQSVSALDDAHVCAMYAAEETDDGGLCLVMAYCEGGTLRDRLRRGSLTVPDALNVATQLASGLARAHQVGIVHRDIKPANVGFTGHDLVKVLDFGIAVRTHHHTDGETTEPTATVVPVGTLPYMAPEVLQLQRPDARSDVWSLGVVLYEMLSGVRPFGADTPVGTVAAILSNEPAPLVRGDGAPIPEALARLVHEMLDKSPVRRPADASAVVECLRALDSATENSRNSAEGRAAAPATSRGMIGWLPWIAAAGVLTIAAVFVTLRGKRESPPPAPLSVVRTIEPLPTIAVLPFAVRGDATLAYLREGMVDLLTPMFDGTGLLRGVDPNSVLGAIDGNATMTLDSAEARAFARRLDVQRYVSGSIVRAGSQLTIRATLHYADGRDVARALVTVKDADGLLLGAESVVRQLVAAELRAPGDTLAAQAASMTTSKRALRAYIDGERELRDARPAAAVEFFSQAVDADSLFALAWYRLARAARWSEVDSINAQAVRRAFSLAPTLPLRIQQLVGAYHALRVGSPMIAERQLRGIVADYPTDVDAWMLLGETLFDNNPYVGRPSSEAAAAFQRVMALDPKNREVTVYLMDLAARSDSRGLLDTLFLMYFSPNSAGEQPGIRQTYLALHARRVRATDRPILDPTAARIALRRTGATPVDLRAAAQFARTLAAPANEASLRVEGLLALAVLDWANGRTDAAYDAWAQATRLNASAALLARAVAAAAPSSPASADTLRSLRLALARGDQPRAGLGLNADEWGTLRAYLGGLLSARLADTLTLATSVQQLASPRNGNRLAAPLREALRGHLARARGNNDAAIAAFEKSIVQLPFEVRARIPALGQQADRFAHAEALHSAGRDVEARAWYASLRDGPALWSTPYLAAVASRIGERLAP